MKPTTTYLKSINTNSIMCRYYNIIMFWFSLIYLFIFCSFFACILLRVSDTSWRTRFILGFLFFRSFFNTLVWVSDSSWRSRRTYILCVLNWFIIIICAYKILYVCGRSFFFRNSNIFANIFDWYIRSIYVHTYYIFISARKLKWH